MHEVTFWICNPDKPGSSGISNPEVPGSNPEVPVFQTRKFRFHWTSPKRARRGVDAATARVAQRVRARTSRTATAQGGAARQV